VGAVDTIEIGSSDESGFFPYHDGDAAMVVTGGQGAPMMGIRLRLTGASVPACLVQTTEYADGAVGSSSAPLVTYARPDGSHDTRPLWIPGQFSPTFRVVVSAGGRRASVSLASPVISGDLDLSTPD
jgi:hypothetical protein